MKQASAFLLLLTLAACEMGPELPTEVAEETAAEAGTTGALLTTYGWVPSGEITMGLIGVRRNGQTTWRCSGIFMQGNWFLTHGSCAQSIPSGGQLVVTNLTPEAGGGYAPMVVQQRSPMAGNRDVLMVRFAANGTSYPVHGLRATPAGATDTMTCYGFTSVGTNMLLGQKLVTAMDPSAATFQFTMGFFEVANPSDTGGVCLVGSDIAGLMRYVDPMTVEVVNLARTGGASLRAEIAGTPAAFDTANTLGLWPLTFNSAGTSLCLEAQPGASGGGAVMLAECGSFWAQGFQVEVLSSTATSTVARWHHRGTGRCVEATWLAGLKLAPCSTSRFQNFRTTYQTDGSIRMQSTATYGCISNASIGAAIGSCTMAGANYTWQQGFGIP